MIVGEWPWPEFFALLVALTFGWLTLARVLERWALRGFVSDRDDDLSEYSANARAELLRMAPGAAVAQLGAILGAVLCAGSRSALR